MIRNSCACVWGCSLCDQFLSSFISALYRPLTADDSSFSITSQRRSTTIYFLQHDYETKKNNGAAGVRMYRLRCWFLYCKLFSKVSYFDGTHRTSWLLKSCFSILFSKKMIPFWIPVFIVRFSLCSVLLMFVSLGLVCTKKPWMVEKLNNTKIRQTVITKKSILHKMHSDHCLQLDEKDQAKRGLFDDSSCINILFC